jgi:hypothetical protein
MSANLYKTAAANAFNTTLNGNISAGDTTITLTSTTNLQFPGVLTFDRQDVNGNDTPTLREYVSFTGISGNQITGVTRGLGGSTAQSHLSNAKVEETFSVDHWNDLRTALLNLLTTAGALDTTKVVDLTSAQALSNKTLTSPTLSGTVAGAATFSGTQTFSQVLTTSNAITATSNAATVPITSKINTVTNNSAATLTITMTTTSAIDGQVSIVRILDASAVAQTITWVNTENSNTSAPTTSNGSTTLPLTVGFMYNAATSKWRCVASA